MFAVLDLPVFPLQAITRLEATVPCGPAVVTEADARHSRVIALNPAAEAVSIEHRMTLAQARSRDAGVLAYSRQPQAEETVMDLLFALAYQHTPRLERTGPGILTLDLKGTRFTSETDFALGLIATAQSHGLELRIGLAPLPDLALFAARTTTAERPMRRAELHHDSLAQLPFEATGISHPLQTLLAQMGLQHLGDFLALPRPEVARRLGEEAIALWEAASGARPRLLRVAKPPRSFRVSQDFEYHVETLEPLLFLLRRFLDQLEEQLRAAGQYASHLELILRIDRSEPYRRRFKLPEPTQRSELLFRILHLHLEQVRTAHAITGLALELTPVDPPHRQRGLFHTALKDPWRLTDTQSQLVGLVGHGRVGRPVLLDTHQPDRFQLEPLLEEVPPLSDVHRERARQWAGAALRRYRPPLEARVWLRHKIPIRLESRTCRGLVEHTHGPFQQSGHWWQKDTAWHRAEWDVELTDGTALRLLQTRNAWHIDGMYD